MFKTVVIGALYSILLTVPSIHAEDTLNVAVLELEGRGITTEEALVLTDKLRAELFNTGKFQVIERSAMEQILKEQGFQQTGCTSNECAVEVGQLIGVSHMIAGSIGKIESTFFVSVRLISVATGKIVKDVQMDITGSLTDVLKQGIPITVKELSKPVSDSGTQVSDSISEPLKPASEEKKKVFPRKGKIVVSLSYSRSIGTSTYDNNDASPSLHDKVNLKTNGFNIGGGYRIGYHYLGVAFTYHVTESLRLNNNDHTLERYLWGINAEYYFERLNVRDIFILAPGVALGYWNLKDRGLYVDEPEKSSDFSFNIFGGPKAKMELGWQRIHLYITYTLLLVLDKREIPSVEWKKEGETPYYEGTYSINNFINLLCFGVSFQFK